MDDFSRRNTNKEETTQMIIYKATNKVNSKSYIGQTVKSLNRRIYEHCRTANRGSKTPFHCAIRKYGRENFGWEEIAWANTIEKLNEYEIRMIDFYNSKAPNGYNLTDGGDGGDTISINPNNKEIRKNISKALKGKTPKNIELLRSKKVLEGRSRRLKKKWENLEFRQKMLESHRSEETRNKRSKSHKGQIPWNKDKKRKE